MGTEPQTVYCHCAHAKVVSQATREKVLQHLCESGREFDAMADLCEMSARKHPLLEKLIGEGPVRIAACYPRAVKWIFAAAGAPLDPENTEILNMRTGSAGDLVDRLEDDRVRPNLPGSSEVRGNGDA